ncbi:phosphatase PAP2 family protein [Nitriliruptoraceae bacterium ZYF776]|nr:phosphatase PAP2 family protein [Profundirhabdus halotolerans]
MRARRGRATTGAALLTVAVSRYLVSSRRGDTLDRAARDALARPLGARADVAVAALTDLGSVYGLAGTAAALAAVGRRRDAAEVAAAGTAAWMAAQGLKPTLQRPRPYQLDQSARLVAIPSGSSWPSGHAAVAAATATAVAPALGPTGRAVAGAAVAGVAASRLYVGVHHLTDVVAGVAVGVVCGRATRRLLRRA